MKKIVLSTLSLSVLLVGFVFVTTNDLSSVAAETTTCAQSFSDDFSSGTLSNIWTPYPDSSNVAVVNEMLELSADIPANPDDSSFVAADYLPYVNGDQTIKIDTSMTDIVIPEGESYTLSTGIMVYQPGNENVSAFDNFIELFYAHSSIEGTISEVASMNLVENSVSTATGSKILDTIGDQNITLKLEIKNNVVTGYAVHPDGSIKTVDSFDLFSEEYGVLVYSVLRSTVPTGFTSYLDNFSINCIDQQNPIDKEVEDGTVWRFFNKENGAHLYTTSINERETVKKSGDKWDYEGEKYKVFLTEKEGTIPVFRFLNTNNGAHLYTTSASERDTIKQNLPYFQYEGVKFYVYDTEQTGTKVVHRFFNKNNGAHLYTDSANEKATVEKDTATWNYEGEKYYVMPL